MMVLPGNWKVLCVFGKLMIFYGFLYLCATNNTYYTSMFETTTFKPFSNSFTMENILNFIRNSWSVNI